jgi:enamine deaminase RidA (YjgF/YER057c/UK114 family)
MPWEEEYGYSQAVKVGDTIYIAGQVSMTTTPPRSGRWPTSPPRLRGVRRISL